ncbi:P-loop containing nucleoside triphosphate hydrolase protein [Lactarius sanguifluus]|nr:P-loop containing nucleoside triphosphate hydrolase protein [Lactarius sanguifluus]
MPSRSKHIEGNSSTAPTHEKLTPEQISELHDAMQIMLGGREPRKFQVEMVQAQEEGQDALCHAATGSGKTAIAAGPYALAKNQGRVTFMVSPLIGLQNEMVETFKNDFNLVAIAINSARGPCTPDTVKEICAGSYQIVLVSPEMMLSRRFINDVLRNHDLLSRVYAIIVDEAHCISHWGAAFRKKYGSLGVVRAFLPKPTPVIAVSASLTQRVSRDITQKLQFQAGYVYKNLGNDRPNVSIVVRAIHNPLHSYTDLDFLVPANVRHGEDLKKTWVYADNIEVGAEIIDHLRTLLPKHLHGVIRPYNAVHGVDYRTAAMDQFRSGKIRVLVCTDAAGMGCNIPDIDVIVQWKLPGKLSSFVQRAGRAARGPNTVGLAVLLVEPTAYSIRTTQPKKHGKKKQVASNTDQVTAATNLPSQPSEEKDYARSHGRFRGARNATNDTLTPLSDPPFSKDDESEGAYIFVQATSCRRNVLRTVFINPAPQPIVPCCDVCDPSLLDLVRPGLRPKSTTKKLAYRKQPNLKIVSALRNWRQKVLIDDKHPRYLPASYILPEEAINKLASLSPCTESTVEGYLSQQWVFWAMYGSDVTAVIISSQLQCENAIPNLATEHQHNAGLGAVHGSGATQYAARNHKRRRSRSPTPIDPLFASTEQAPQRQQRTRHTVTNTPSSSNATVETSSWSQTQSPHPPFPQPIFVVPSNVPRPQPPTMSRSHLYHHSVPSNAPPLRPLFPYRPLSSQHVTLTGTEASPVPPLLHQPQPISPFYRSHPIVPSNAPLGPLSPYRLPLSSQHVTSTPSRTPVHSSTPFLSHPQPLRQPAARNPSHYSTPFSNPTVDLRRQTPMPLSHRWSSASNPVPAAASRLYPQAFDISDPHSPFHGHAIVASSSGRSHTAARQHNLTPTFKLPTPSPTPFSNPQYRQRAVPTELEHPAPPHLGIFTPFPSTHPLPPEKRHNFLDFSPH